MNARVVRYLLSIALLGAILGGGWYATRPQPVKVRLATVERGEVESIVANTRAGTVKACRRARLAPSVGGQIAVLNAHEGLRVKAGALLLALWADDLAAQLRLAEREADAARSKTEAACLQADQARREAQRQNKLKARSLVSEDQVEKANTEASALAADCEAAQASAKVQQARIGVARANLEKTRLTAPFAGVVAEVTGELHEYVTPSPPGIPTPPAVDLIDDSCFYVSAPIDEVDAARIRVDQHARISLDAFGERRFRGRVRRIAPYVLDLEKQARTVEVEVEFERNGDEHELLAGYSADVEIVTDRRDGVLRIPTEALMDQSRVYRFDPKEQLIREQEVETGLTNWESTEIRAGLDADDRVVVSLAQEGLADGVAARPEAQGKTAGDGP
jgi:HlyD family secretion protein